MIVDINPNIELKEWNIPEHMDETSVEWWDKIRESLSKSNSLCRGRIFDMYGNTLWEEPIEDYNNRLRV